MGELADVALPVSFLNLLLGVHQSVEPSAGALGEVSLQVRFLPLLLAVHHTSLQSPAKE